jgi:cytochrome c5
VNFRFPLRLICFAACVAVLATRAQNTPAQNKPSAAKPAASKASANESAEGERRFETHCGRCHVPPEDLSPREAKAVLRQMRVRANLSAEDQRLILKYLAP